MMIFLSLIFIDMAILNLRIIPALFCTLWSAGYNPKVTNGQSHEISELKWKRRLRWCNSFSIPLCELHLAKRKIGAAWPKEVMVCGKMKPWGNPFFFICGFPLSFSTPSLSFPPIFSSFPSFGEDSMGRRVHL